MLPADNSQNIFWDVQVSIAKDIARLTKPSIAKLHHDILEEFGQQPGSELIEYFVSIAEIPQEEIEEYYNFTGISNDANTRNVKTAPRESNKDPYLQVADSIAYGNTPTVLKFCQAFIEEHGEPPSMKLIEYFLAKIQTVPKSEDKTDKKESSLDFVEKLAGEPNPTVLKFRQSYIKQYGSPPPGDLTQQFLLKIQEKASTVDNETADDDFDSKVIFAKTVARGLISTILDFRWEFKKSFGEEPQGELIDIFIKNLSNKTD